MIIYFFFSSRRRHTRFDCDWSSDVCFFRSRRARKNVDHFSESDYSHGVRRHRLNKGGFLFKRTRYQHGSVEREERKKGADVWVYRWWEEDIYGKLLHRKLQIGDVETYPNES